VRLTKVQRWFKKNNIEYEYKEDEGCGEIRFERDGVGYTVTEYTGNSGYTVAGILTNLSGRGLWDAGSQKSIVEILERKFK